MRMPRVLTRGTMVLFVLMDVVRLCEISRTVHKACWNWFEVFKELAFTALPLVNAISKSPQGTSMNHFVEKWDRCVGMHHSLGVKMRNLVWGEFIEYMRKHFYKKEMQRCFGWGKLCHNSVLFLDRRLLQYKASASQVSILGWTSLWVSR